MAKSQRRVGMDKLSSSVASVGPVDELQERVARYVDEAGCKILNSYCG